MAYIAQAVALIYVNLAISGNVMHVYTLSVIISASSRDFQPIRCVEKCAFSKTHLAKCIK